MQKIKVNSYNYHSHRAGQNEEACGSTMMHLWLWLYYHALHVAITRKSGILRQLALVWLRACTVSPFPPGQTSDKP